MPRQPVTVLYDDSCGFCRWSLALVLGWDRRRRLRPVPIDSPAGQAILAGMDSERAHATAHALTADGRLLSDGAAVPEIARALPGGALPAYLARAAPGLTARAYEWVAGHREPFGKALTKGQRRRAAARLADRRGSGTEAPRAL